MLFFFFYDTGWAVKWSQGRVCQSFHSLVRKMASQSGFVWKVTQFLTRTLSQSLVGFGSVIMDDSLSDEHTLQVSFSLLELIRAVLCQLTLRRVTLEQVHCNVLKEGVFVCGMGGATDTIHLRSHSQKLKQLFEQLVWWSGNCYWNLKNQTHIVIHYASSFKFDYKVCFSFCKFTSLTKFSCKVHFKIW